MNDGHNVLVAAPTGSGKTVVGEFAVADALASGGRAFYTAPIKALSNQKFNDLRRDLGEHMVGLLTGDHTINGDAPVVVMTTEVLRNMVYARPESLHDLRWVVLDEVHFLQDTYRGAVWEEVLIHTPAPVRFACLSATVSNASELGDWIGHVRGTTITVVEHHRPVELDPLYLVGDRHSERDHLVPLLIDGRPNPRGGRFDADDQGRRGRGPQRGRPRRRFRTPWRTEVIDRLREESLLPAIVFVFSRRGCDEAAARCLDSGVRLTTPQEGRRIRLIIEDKLDSLSDSDLDVLGYDRWSETLALGVAAHHAGMVPAFREAVEQCFVEGLVKVVFATETLALGINMPARSVVIEQLTKFTGDGHDLLTPAQFTQLAGRAGRRGIDDRGAVVVLWSSFQSFATVAELAASREFTLRSAFGPTYNMAANLVDRHGPGDARRILGRSFAQFQADRSVSGLRTRRAQSEDARVHAEVALSQIDGVGVPEAMALLDLVTEEHRLRRHGPGTRSAINRSLTQLSPGDVIERSTDKGPRLLVVIATAERRNTVRVEALTARGTVVRLDGRSLDEPVTALGRVQLPVPHQPRDDAFRREAAARLRRVNRKRLKRPQRTTDDAAVRRWEEARDLAAAHPLAGHGEVEQILGAARSIRKADKDLADLDRRIGRRGSDLVARFDAVLGVLEELGHLDLGDPDNSGEPTRWELTPAGRRLRRIYHESDLLVSLALGAGLFDDLAPAEVAAIVSCISHEHRGKDAPPPARLPTPELQRRWDALWALARDLAAEEARAGLVPTREPSAGFARAAWSWAAGQPLDSVLTDDMTGGDFVRNAKQLIDLLGQVADVAGGNTSTSARVAATQLRRDVVSAGGGPR